MLKPHQEITFLLETFKLKSCKHNICLACKPALTDHTLTSTLFFLLYFSDEDLTVERYSEVFFFFFSYCAHFIDLSRGLEEETFASSTNAFCVGSHTLLGTCVECVSSQSLCFSKSFFLRVFRFSSLIKNPYFIRSVLL